jgi:hypothetical protein
MVAPVRMSEPVMDASLRTISPSLRLCVTASVPETRQPPPFSPGIREVTKVTVAEVAFVKSGMSSSQQEIW